MRRQGAHYANIYCRSISALGRENRQSNRKASHVIAEWRAGGSPPKWTGPILMCGLISLALRGRPQTYPNPTPTNALPISGFAVNPSFLCVFKHAYTCGFITVMQAYQLNLRSWFIRPETLSKRYSYRINE